MIFFFYMNCLSQSWSVIKRRQTAVKGDWNPRLEQGTDNVLIRDMNGVDDVPRPACLDLKGTEREE